MADLTFVLLMLMAPPMPAMSPPTRDMQSVIPAVWFVGISPALVAHEDFKKRFVLLFEIQH